MIEENKYTGNIPFRTSSPDEIQLFQSVIGLGSGTLYEFPLNIKLRELIRSQFGINDETKDMEPEKLWSVKYGQTELNFKYQTAEKMEYTLKLYNPTASPDIIGTISETNISLLVNETTGHTRFIIEEPDAETKELTEYEFQSTLKSCSKNIEKVSNSKRGYKNGGNYVLKAFMPQMNVPLADITGANIISLYAKKELGNRVTDKNIKKFTEKVPIVRSRIQIGGFEIDHLDARAGSDANLQNAIQCELSYSPLSTKEEPRDKVINLQKNKHQLEPIIPKQLRRLIEYLRNKKCKEIKEMRNNLEPSEIVITPKPKKEKKAKKDKKDETTNTDGNDDDNSSINSTSTSSSNSNVKVGGGSAVDQVDDNNDATGEGATSTGKPSKSINVPSHRKGLVMGSELIDKLGLLASRLNAEQGYDDADYITLFNILKKIEHKE
jgi:hypothetical protein